MKKNDPKIILNVQITNEELEEKVKIAMDKYTEQLVLKNLDDTIIKIVNKRIDALINSKSWNPDGKIDNMSFERFVQVRTENLLIDTIDKYAKEILTKKLAALI